MRVTPKADIIVGRCLSPGVLADVTHAVTAVQQSKLSACRMRLLQEHQLSSTHVLHCEAHTHAALAAWQERDSTR